MDEKVFYYVPVLIKGLNVSRTGLVPRNVYVPPSGKRKGHFRQVMVRASDIEATKAAAGKTKGGKDRMSDSAARDNTPATELEKRPLPSEVESEKFLAAEHALEFSRSNDPRKTREKFDSLRAALYGDEPLDLEEAVSIATGEAAQQMQAMGISKGASGVGWYERVGTHVRTTLTTHFPDLADDAEWQGFLGILAVSSAKKSPKNNMAIALKMYSSYKLGGDVQAAIEGGGALPVVSNKLAKLLEMSGNDLKQFGRWLGEERKVSELRKWAKATPGIGDTGVAGLEGTDVVTNSWMLGPKVGKFYENMAGNFSMATVDTWAVRTTARVLNVALVKEETSMGPEERGHINYLFNRVSENLGIEVADVQALLWYYEKRLWEHLGLGKIEQSWDYEESADNLAALYAAGESIALDPDEEEDEYE